VGAVLLTLTNVYPNCCSSLNFKVIKVHGLYMYLQAQRGYDYVYVFIYIRIKFWYDLEWRGRLAF
jgi:hypothetical protein